MKKTLVSAALTLISFSALASLEQRVCSILDQNKIGFSESLSSEAEAICSELSEIQTVNDARNVARVSLLMSVELGEINSMADKELLGIEYQLLNISGDATAKAISLTIENL